MSDRLKRERDARLRARLHLLLVIRSGEVTTRQAAAKHLAVHRNSIANWLRLYEQGGIERLLDIRVGGPPAEQKTLPADVFQELVNLLAEDTFPTYVAAREWLMTAHDLNVPYRTVHNLIRYRLGVRLGKRSNAGE